MKDFNIYLELVPDDVVLHLLMSFDIASVLKFRQVSGSRLFYHCSGYISEHPIG